MGKKKIELDLSNKTVRADSCNKQTDVKVKQVIVVGGDKHYTHHQDTPALQWVVAHNLNKQPAVSIVDSSGNEVDGEVKYLDENTVIISFSHEFGGTAYFN